MKTAQGAVWGSKEQPYWHPGPNLTADLVALRDGKEGREVLLVQRSAASPSEPGRWALPGGFVETNAGKGEVWQAGLETPIDAAFREAKEETGLNLEPFKNKAKVIGTYEGNQRDPRDNAEAWSKSTAFVIDVGKGPHLVPKGADDAARAEWKPLASLPSLAFDHQQIIDKGLKVLAFHERLRSSATDKSRLQHDMEISSRRSKAEAQDGAAAAVEAKTLS